MLEQKIRDLFVSHRITLALAESCTGGSVAARLVAVPDASQYFLGGVVAYSDTAKQRLLGVKAEALAAFGAVSEPVALQMAQGALERFGADVALAVTGIAGPTGESPGKPVGTVSYALVIRGSEPHTWTTRFTGERAAIISQSGELLLESLLNSLSML